METAAETTEVPAVQAPPEQNTAFLVEAYSFGLMIQEYCQLAQEKATIPAVKSFAEESAKWHRQVSEELAETATVKGISLPKAAGQDVELFMEELAALPPAVFEKKFLQVLSDIQPKLISVFQTAAEEAEDAQLRAWAAQTLPYLEAHALAVDELAAQQEK